MEMFVINCFSTTIKLFALMTPPAILSAFISGAKYYNIKRVRQTALKTSVTIFIIGLFLLLIGNSFFTLFGFTLDAFRIGSGALLFLTAVSLMNDSGENNELLEKKSDISVIPLAIPLGMGPATIGTIIVMGTSTEHYLDKIVIILSLLFASLAIYLMLLASKAIARLLRVTRITILSKMTALLLAAIASQAIFVGISGFL